VSARAPGGRKPLPCPGCGEVLIPEALRFHLCDWWSWLDHQVDLRRSELGRFESELGAYLDSPRGRFDLWYAEHRRLVPPPVRED
jgi:hypothetical protein